LDNEVSKRLAAAGVPVVGVSSRHFWSQPKREDVGKDMAPIAAVNQKRWKRTRFVLIGSSLGADVAPFMANHLDSAACARLVLVGLLAPGRYAKFPFHASDWITDSNSGTPITPQMGKLQALPIGCLYGPEEKASSLCTVPQLRQRCDSPSKLAIIWPEITMASPHACALIGHFTNMPLAQTRPPGRAYKRE